MLRQAGRFGSTTPRLDAAVEASMDLIAVVRDLKTQVAQIYHQLVIVEERAKVENLEKERHKAECAVLKRYAGMEE
jgi:hypothetical protein